MKRSLLVASLLALSPLLVPNGASAEPATKAACTEPVPDRNYGAERVV